MPRWPGLLALALLAPTALWAAEGTEVASAMDEGDPFDLYVTVNYMFEARRAAMKREATGRGGSEPIPAGATPIVRDLLFKQNRHILTPRVAIGVFHDLELSVALPIVLSDSRTFSFDQSADPCELPPDPTPTCIGIDPTDPTNTNSLTLRDGILPLNGSSMGYDADNPTLGFNPTQDTMVFRGVNRSGLDQIHLGIAWAPLNQERDDTKPTWVIGTQYRISIGKIAHFDRLNPGSEDGVSSGVHQFYAYTSLSKKTSWSEPFVTFWWLAPIGYRGTSPDDQDGSLFWEVGYGSESHQIQQQAGTQFGFEAIPWENPRQEQKISLEFSGRIESHFEGRGYSEMWEIFAFAGDPSGSGPLVLDRDPTTAGLQAMPHPGVTVIENYLTFAGRFGVRGKVGPNAKFNASFEIANDQKHRITWTDAGNESSDDTDEVITPGTKEVNPLHAPIIDTTGRNYVADDNTVYTFLVSGTVMF